MEKGLHTNSWRKQLTKKQVREGGLAFMHGWNLLSIICDFVVKTVIFIECFTTTFLRAHSWLNWVDCQNCEEIPIILIEKWMSIITNTHSWDLFDHFHKSEHNELTGDDQRHEEL